MSTLSNVIPCLGELMRYYELSSMENELIDDALRVQQRHVKIRSASNLSRSRVLTLRQRPGTLQEVIDEYRILIIISEIFNDSF